MMLRGALLVLAGLLQVLPTQADTASDFAADAMGVWTNAEQSADSGYDFIHSEVTRVSLPGSDDVWLLQQNWIIGETASATDSATPDIGLAPYFQVLILFRDFGDGTLHSSTYRLAAPNGKAGALSIHPTQSGSIEPDWIGNMVCMGNIQRIAHGYWDGAANCPNGYKGGVRVDSRSMRAPDTYVNWDRGFDVDGKHIWGPATGGYIFKRRPIKP